MRFRMISSRFCESADQIELRKFRCCGHNAPEYEMDVQRYVRGLNVRKETADAVRRMVLYCEGEPGILGFCEFGWIECADAYAVSFIGIALSERGHGLGRLLLATVLRWIGNDASENSRANYVMTQIDPRNHASIHLFQDLGFEDEGVDEDDPEYHIWSKEFKPEKTDRLRLSQLIQVED